jgi:hypothetical protein
VDEKQAQLEQLAATWMGNQLMQLARQQVEIDSLRAQLAKAYADLAAAQKAQVVEE